MSLVVRPVRVLSRDRDDAVTQRANEPDHPPILRGQGFPGIAEELGIRTRGLFDPLND
jgi:hypothetical protein